jgi:hypothetical protein
MEIQEAAVSPPTAPNGSQLAIPAITTHSSSSKLKNSSSSVLTGGNNDTLPNINSLTSPSDAPPSPTLGEESKLEDKKNLIKLKLLGVTEEEMKRWSALKKMGLTDDDFAMGAQYAAETAIQGKDNLTKAEKLTGYTERQQKRCKAVKTLGTSEEEIIETRSKFLGQIGRNHEQPVVPSTPSAGSGASVSATSQFPKIKRWSSM